jgi:acetylornithine deacetylase/succinyl-diaminopimelate desuccinylase-like protein
MTLSSPADQRNSAMHSGNVQQEVARVASSRPVHAALEWFRTHARELAERQLEVTRIPAPPFGEQARSEWLRARFAELGLENVHVDEVGNVFGVRPGTRSDVPYLAVTAHLDTVFPVGTPLEVHREGDKLYGPGISDNSAGLIALLALASAMQAANLRNTAPLVFIANVGEEGEGDLRGMRHVFADPKWRDTIGSTLVLDGAGAETVVTEALGSRRLEVTVRGPGGHSWSDFGTPNPIVLLSRVIDRFSRVAIPANPRTTFNIGVISGGTSVNSIPESASMRVDLRSSLVGEIDRLEKTLRDEAAEVIASEIRSQVDKRTGSARDLGVEIKVIGNRPGAELPPEARLLKVVRAVDTQLGIYSRSQRASTDANIPMSIKREAVAIGAGGSGGGAHTMHEWFDISNRELGLKRILLIALTLTGVEE